MDRSEAAQTLEAVHRLRAETRRRLDPSWYPRLILGAFFVGVAIVAATELPDAVAYVYWIGGLGLAVAAIVAYYGRRERRLGIESHAWDRSMTLLVVMVVALVAANQLTDGGTDTAVAVVAVAAVATAGFAWLGRDPIAAIAAGAMALLAVAYAVVGVREPELWVNGGIGVILVASGIAGLIHERSQVPPGYRSGAARA